MAELTAYLQSPGTPPSAPAQTGGGSGGANFIGGLTRLASAGLKMYANNQDSQRQAQRDYAEQQKAYEQNLTDAALDETEGALFGELNAANDRLRASQAAVAQGRAPQSSLDLNLEKVVTDLYSKYPERRAEIGQYLQGRGFSHYLFRESKEATDRQDAQTATELSGEKTSYDAAVKHGISGKYEDMVSAGRTILQSESDFERVRQEMEITKTKHDITKDEREWSLKQLDREGSQALIKQMSVSIGPLLDQIFAASSAVGSDLDKQRTFNEIMPQVQTGLEAARLHYEAVAQSLTPEGRAVVKDWFDQRKKSIEDITSGGLSNFNIAKQNMDAMKTKWGVDAAHALPLYSQLSAVFGKEAVTNILGGTTPIDPEVQKRILKEVQAYEPNSTPEEASVHFYNLTRLLRGDLSFQQLSPKDAREQLPSLVATARGVEQSIAKDGVTAEEAQRYEGSYGNVLNAAIMLQPGTTTFASIDKATSLVANNTARATLQALIKDPETRERGEALTQASRNVALRNLEMTKELAARYKAPLPQTPPSYESGSLSIVNPTMPNIPWSGKVVFDDKRGEYVVQSKKATIGGVNQDLVNMARSMNENLQHLVVTASMDPTVPKGLTPLELRKAYANGVNPKPKSKDGKPVKTADDQFIDTINSIKDQARQLTTGVIEDPNIPLEGKISFKSPIDAIVRTVIGEAGAEGDVGMQAVAAVIKNRAKSSGLSPEEVVLAKNQFEPWGTAKSRQRLLSIDENSPEYQQALLNVLAVLEDGVDPTGGATHFYSPTLQAKLGRAAPKWDDGTGVDIGRHRFFKHEYNG